MGAVGALAGYRATAAPDERTLALERRSELVAAALSAAFTAELAAAVLTVLAAHGLAGSIRGAMCAYGVVASSRWGHPALAASLAASVGCAAWLGVHRVDARLPQGSLVRLTSALALGVVPLVLLDTLVGARFLTGLDLDAAATCCSVALDARSAGSGPGGGTAPVVVAVTGITAALAALGAAVALARRPSGGRALSLALLTPAAAWAAVRAAADVVSPYTWELPQHRCVYCLLRPEAAPAGPLLWAALAAATLSGAAVWGVAPVLRRGAVARRAAAEVLGEIGRVSAVAWAVALAAGLWPVVHYAWAYGTLALWR